MPNCEVALYKQGELVASYHRTVFSDDFLQVIEEAVRENDDKPDMAIVWLGLRPFGFHLYHRYGFEARPMVFYTTSRMALLGTNLVWPAGCYLSAIPAFNLEGWYEGRKYYLDHPYRTRPLEHSEMFGIDNEPETILIGNKELGPNVLFVSTPENHFD